LVYFCLASTIWATIATAQTTSCPPTNFDSLSDFDFDGFIEDRWYSIMQLPVVYQPLNQFYCVYAEYTKVTKKSWFCSIFRCEDPPTIKVFNSARRGSTSGRVSSINFEGTLTDADQSTSKAKVSFPLVPRPLRRGSNYWVVAAGKFNELPSVKNYTASDLTYDYAIITSGEPDTAGENGCYSSGGMWFFSKANILPEGALGDMEKIANDLGLSTDELRPVEQAGCEY
jgi:apolipoprotein D and lipocalin family protein